LLAKQSGDHLVNYIYSLINSLEELNVTTIITINEPNSPTAQKITHLFEDAVVGSFALSNISTMKGEQRHFSIHKMVDIIKPPTTFKVSIEFGSGMMLDQPKQAAALTPTENGIGSRDILDLPLQIALLDQDEDTLVHLEEIFHTESQIAIFESQEEFLMQSSDLDFDFVIINTAMPALNWRRLLIAINEQTPQLPKFVISSRSNALKINQVARQVGADGLFVKPIDPGDLVGAFYKALKKYGTLERLIQKRRAFAVTSDIPEDFDDFDIGDSGIDRTLEEATNLLTPQAFREKLYRLVWRSRQQETFFSLVSFKVVYISSTAKREHMQQELELVKRIAVNVQTSLRGINDNACRYMDKVVVLLENSDKEGSRAFTRRVIKELRTELQSKLNLQVGKHLNILSAILTFPEDGEVADELMHQVTDVSRNFVKTNY